MLTDKNHYTVQGWMVNQLELSGVELQVYAILWGFSQDGSTGSRTPKRYFLDWGFCNDERTLTKAITSLLEKGLIVREMNAGMTPEYKCVPPAKMYPLQKCTPCKNEGGTPCKNVPPINNNNINNAQYARANELFDLWWTIYKGRSGRGGCLSYWHNLTEEEMQQVIEHSKRYIEKAVAPLHPYAYLVTYQYWRNETPKRECGEQPKPEEKPSMAGKVLVRIDGELQTVEKKYAEENGLFILADYEK